MTSNLLLHAMVPLIADLARDIPASERYRRLLQALRQLLPGDAVALLQCQGEWLLPLAVEGLSADTLGRRFRVSEHPRFAALLDAGEAMLFAPECSLPDPYDGLVEGQEGQLEVHDCMGCVLRVGERTWGLLTLDALEPGRFSTAHLQTLQDFAGLASATVHVAARIDQLAHSAEDERRRAESYSLAVGGGVRRLLGHSPAHKQVMKEIALVSASDLTVLVTGETGVGKELVAHALHAGSPRAARPLVSVNCAALPEALVESELFGHVRGAFSGAVGDRRGKFELADGGTLFLDEVGELPLGVQAKLLRVLQSGHLQRLGSDEEHRVDVRLIAATNRDLADEVRARRFRADLYHRVSVYPLRVPPLRERGRDVLVLSGAFLEENRSRLGLGGLRLAPDAQAALLAYAWPGNVRELEHLVGRSVLKAVGRYGRRPRILTLGAEDLDLHPAGATVPAVLTEPVSDLPVRPLREATEDFERRWIAASLARHDNNWSRAARELGLDRANLRRLAQRLGMSVQGSRGRPRDATT